jgi:hypothetical protein
MRRALTVFLCCAAALSAPALGEAGVGAVPGTHTYKPAGLGLSFVLPSDWAGAKGTGAAGSRFEGTGPGSVATLRISTAKTAASLSALGPQLRSAVRQQSTKADPQASLTTRSKTIDSSVPALQITVRYHGLWRSGVDDLTHVIYFFVHGGALYEFDYMAVDPWTSKYLPSFVASAKSIRFLQVA